MCCRQRCRSRCCNSRCGNSCCGNSSSTVYVCYRARFEDVPMQTYYGPGYSARDVLENMADSLETIAQRMT